MCLDDIGDFRPAAESQGITDELDNQVITSEELETKTECPPQPAQSEEETELSEDDKRKQIGDEFYQEAETESAQNIEVKVTGSIIAVTSEAGELISVSPETAIPVTGTFSLQTAQEATEELGQKLEEQLLSDSPPANTTPSPHPPIPTPTIISFIPAPENGLNPSGLFQEDLSGQTGQPPQLQPEEPMVVSYAGGVTIPAVTASDSLYHSSLSSHMMTATTETVLDSVLVSGLVKNEPEDLTGQRQRHGSDITLDVTAKLLDKSGMGLVTSPDGDSHIILNTEDLPLAPGFTTTTTGYDPPSFYSSSEAGARLYGAPEAAGGYRDQDLYGEPGYQGRGGQGGGQTYSLYPGAQGLSVDLPSPDSGLGSDQITPKGFVDGDSTFDYTQNILNDNTIPRKAWHDYGSRNSDTEKVQIPKVYSPYGFHYILDAATSSAVRREDDKVTYINKGQFYGVTLEYTPDPEQSLKSATVKSVIMLVFRDGKSTDEEIKAWQFWHQRQHSIKQRIIDVDTKNSIGLLGHIEELSHNALAVYWNPLESPAKVNLAIQCLSTDFSTQKGVKGLPLHVQIDTYEDPRADVSTPPNHRGYSQVKIFCDKGAERKLRDEERRAAKRRMTPSGKRRLDEMYHESFERTEFYAMSDLTKPSTLFTPPEDPERSSQLGSEFPSFYSPQQRPAEQRHPNISNGSDLLPALMSGAVIEPKQEPPFPEKSSAKRARLVPPVSERIMIYVRQETEDVYTPLHLVPPTVHGLINAIENKYKISATNIRFLYRKNKDGIVAKVDDDMLRHYCNEDVFLMQVMVTEGPAGEESSVYDITLSEIHQNM